MSILAYLAHLAQSFFFVLNAINKKNDLIHFWACKYSWASLERISRDCISVCSIVNLPYCHYRNNYKISHRAASCMPYKRVRFSSAPRTRKHVSEHGWLFVWMILSILAHLAHLAQSYFSLIFSTINTYNCSKLILVDKKKVQWLKTKA